MRKRTGRARAHVIVHFLITLREDYLNRITKTDIKKNGKKYYGESKISMCVVDNDLVSVLVAGHQALARKKKLRGSRESPRLYIVKSRSRGS